MKSAPAKTESKSSRGWHGVRIFAGSLLVVASLLKCWQLATEPIIENSLFDSRWLLVVAVEFEILLGLWLLANICAKHVWAVTLACFGLFACVSFCKAISGHASCGCFGRWSINPWYTGILDVALVASLVRWRPKESFFAIRRATAILLVWIVAGVPVAYVTAGCADAVLLDNGEIAGDSGDAVVLSPDAWVDRPFSLLRYIDNGHLLRKGEWVVLFYRHDCSVCRDVIPKYQALARKFTEKNAGPKVALIECPPYGDPGTPVNERRAWLSGQLSSCRRWVMKTPVSLIMEDGVVSSVLYDAQPDLLEKIWLNSP